MSNPWNQSLQDVALRSFLQNANTDRFPNEITLSSYSALIAKRLDGDPSDLITKLRKADDITNRCGDVEKLVTAEREAKVIDTIHRELLSLLEDLSIKFIILDRGTNRSLSTALEQAILHCEITLEHALIGGSSSLIPCIQACQRLVDMIDVEELAGDKRLALCQGLQHIIERLEDKPSANSEG